jgi:ribonuclease HI
VDVYNADSKKVVRQMVGTGDRSTDQQWKRSPKVRNLMMSAYAAVNNASKDDTEAFIEGCVVVAG